MLEQANTLAGKIENYRHLLTDLNGGILVYEDLWGEEDYKAIVRGLGADFLDKLLSKSISSFALSFEKHRLPPLSGFRKVFIDSLRTFGPERMTESAKAAQMVLRVVIAKSLLPAGTCGNDESVSQVNDFLVPILEIIPTLVHDPEILQELEDSFDKACDQFHLNATSTFSWKGSYLILKLAQVFNYALDSLKLLSVVETCAEYYLDLEHISWDPEMFIWLEKTFPQADVDFKDLREDFVKGELIRSTDILMPYEAMYPTEVQTQHFSYSLPLIADTLEKVNVLEGDENEASHIECFGGFLVTPLVVSILDTDENRPFLVRIIAAIDFPSDLEAELAVVYGDPKLDLSELPGLRSEDLREVLNDISASYSGDITEPEVSVVQVWSDDLSVGPMLPESSRLGLMAQKHSMTRYPLAFKKLDVVPVRSGFTNISPSNEEAAEVIMNYETRVRLLRRHYRESRDMKVSLELVLKWFYDDSYFEYVRNESSVITAFSGHSHGNCDSRMTAMGTLIMDALSFNLDSDDLFVESLDEHVRLVVCIDGEWFILEGKHLQAYEPTKGTTLTKWVDMYKAVQKKKKAPIAFDYREPFAEEEKPGAIVHRIAKEVLAHMDGERPRDSVAAHTLPVATAEYQSPLTTLAQEVEARIRSKFKRPKFSTRASLSDLGRVPHPAVLAATMALVLGTLYVAPTPTEASVSVVSTPMILTRPTTGFQQMLMTNIMSYDGTAAVLNPPDSGVITLSEYNTAVKKSGWEVLFQEGHSELIVHGENLDLAASLRELRAALPKLNNTLSVELNSGQLGGLKIFVSAEGEVQVEGEARAFNLSERLALEEMTLLMLNRRGRL